MRRRLLTALEPLRASAELASVGPAAPLLATAPKGDGGRVVVLPGFLASDTSTVLLRRFVDTRNHRTTGWGLGRNLGYYAMGEAVTAFLDEQTEAGPVSIVGWSLGGLFGRIYARRRPERVARLITLGSPIGRFEDDQPDAPWGVPCTAIFSRTDGIVPDAIAQETAGALTENIEVIASHIGLGVNPAVLWAVADRLAAPADDWQRFQPPAILRPVISSGRAAADG